MATLRRARFRHPEIGEVTFDYEVLRPGVDAQRMTIYQQPGGVLPLG